MSRTKRFVFGTAAAIITTLGTGMLGLGVSRAR